MTGAVPLVFDALLSVLGTSVAMAVFWPILRMLSHETARGLDLLLLLPGAGLACWLPDHILPQGWRCAMLQGVCLAPLALITPLQARARLAPGLRRAAAGLGAGRLARLRLLWWPNYGSPLMLGAALALLAGGGIQAGRALLSSNAVVTDSR